MQFLHMAESSIVVQFPYKIEGREYSACIHTEVVRKENVVTFALPFCALVATDAEKAYTVHYTHIENRMTVCIEYKSMNDAMQFMAEREIHISYMKESKLLSVNEEIARVAQEMEEEAKRSIKRKKNTETDADGFIAC